MFKKNDIRELVELIVRDGSLSVSEHELFIDLIGMDGVLDENELAQISRIFGLIDRGELIVERENVPEAH